MFNKSLTAALALSATFASAEELKLADFQPTTHPFVAKVYEPFGAAVAEATGGEVTVKVYAGGALGGGPAEQYDRAVEGIADITFGLPGYTASTFPKTLLTELPGVIDAETGTAAINANLDALSDEYRRVQLVGLWTNAPNLILTADNPIRSLDDIKGLKIRVPSRNAGLVVEAWGGSPVSMPAPEVYNAMQTGTIDGAMIDATALRTFKLAEVTDYVTTGMDTTISSFFLVMNRDSYDGLSADVQAAIVKAGGEAAVTANAIQMAGASAALEEFSAGVGHEVITLTSEEATRFNEAAAPVVAEVIAAADAEGIDATGFVTALSQ